MKTPIDQQNASVDWKRVNKELAQFIKSYIDKLSKDANSERSVARHIGINRGTMKSILNEESSPARSRRVIEAILNLTFKQQSTKDHINDLNDKEISKALRECLKVSETPQSYTLINDAQSLPYLDKRYTRIMLLAQNTGGVSEKLLREVFGEAEINLANELVYSKHLEKENDRYFTSEKFEDRGLPPFVTKQVAITVLEQCLETSFYEKSVGKFNFFTQKVDKQNFYNDFKIIFHRFINSTRDCIAKYPGDDNIFVVAGMDTIIKENLGEIE